MGRLIACLLLVVLHCGFISGSNRTFRWMYRPYGPKMCGTLHEDGDFSFRFVKEYLSCHRVAANSSKSPDEDSSENSTFHSKADSRMIKYHSLVDSSSNETSDDDAKDHSADGTSKLHPELTTAASCGMLGPISLHAASSQGNLCLVKYVLSHNLEDINIRDSNGKTPVMVAAMHGRNEVFDFLVSNNCSLTGTDESRITLLHLAVYGKSFSIVKTLLDTGQCDLDARDSRGQTPVMWAVNGRNCEAFYLLVSRGCSLKAVDNKKNNVLHIASKVGHAEIVEHILQKNSIDVQSTNKWKKTPLMIAKASHHPKIVALLWQRAKH